MSDTPHASVHEDTYLKLQQRRGLPAPNGRALTNKMVSQPLHSPFHLTYFLFVLTRSKHTLTCTSPAPRKHLFDLCQELCRRRYSYCGLKLILPAAFEST